MGFGPTTSTLARLRSTPELYPHLCDVVFNNIFEIKCKSFFEFFSKKIITCDFSKIYAHSVNNKNKALLLPYEGLLCL